MTMFLSNRWFLAAVLTVLIAVPVLGQAPAIDYLGFGWETGSLPPSDAGDEFVFVGVADSADPLFGVDLGTTELTFHVYGLISTGQVDLGFGVFKVSYTGGTMDIFTDNSMDADWGTFPPNAVAPSTFSNGSLLFRGAFIKFEVFFTPDGSGSFEGSLDGVSGDLIGDICTNCAYTWGGIFTVGTGAQILDGYDFQMDGVFEIDPAVSNTDVTWGHVKTLYR